MKGNYLLVILIFGSLQLAAQNDTIVIKNILYGGEADKNLALDIYKLKEQKSRKLVLDIYKLKEQNNPISLCGYMAAPGIVAAKKIRHWVYWVMATHWPVSIFR